MVVLFRKLLFSLAIVTLLCQFPYAGVGPSRDSTSRVQICLIIDTSNSMEGLLYQAQTQIWTLLDFINQFQKKKKPNTIEIALIAMGNDMFLKEEGYIQMVTDFTSNRDFLADKLFLLETSGGTELFPRAAQRALEELNWRSESDFKAIIIAGNEEFNQGDTSWDKVSDIAAKRNIVINTVFCGDKKTGESLAWKRAAELAKGTYTYITQQTATNKETPFDKDIVRLYGKYLDSYNDSLDIVRRGKLPKQKISPAYRDLLFYRFEHQPLPKDVIDYFEEADWDFGKITPEMLTEKLKSMDDRELKQYLVKKAQLRANAKEGLRMYKHKIDEFLKIKLDTVQNSNSLEQALKAVIGEQLKARKFKVIEVP